MYHKRLTAYRSVGYNIKSNNSESAVKIGIYDKENYFEHMIQDIKVAEKYSDKQRPYISYFIKEFEGQGINII